MKQEITQTANNRRYMMVYALRLKQISTAGVFWKILEQLLSRIILGGFFGKKKGEEKKDAQWPCGFRFLLFSRAHIYWVTKQSSFSTNFHIAELFNLDHVIRFYKPKKELSSAIFTIKILVAETFGKLCGNCAFPQNFHTRILGEITVFFAVYKYHLITLITLRTNILLKNVKGVLAV